MKLWNLTQNLEADGNFGKAQKAQGIASLAEAALLKGGVRPCILFLIFSVF